MKDDELIQLVGTLDPVDRGLTRSWDDSDARHRLRSSITASPRAPKRRAGPRVRRLIVAVALLTAVATTGWTSYHLLRADTTDGFGCRMPDGGVAIIDLVSGDYARDCAAMWQLHDALAPPLAAYERPAPAGPMVEVVPAGESVPRSWVALDATAEVDTSLIELESSLDDHIDGLVSTCHDADRAAAFVEQELERLELTSWAVEVEQRGGPGECAWAFVDAARSSVRVRMEERADRSPELYAWMAYAEALRAAFADACIALDEAEARAQRTADRIDAGRRDRPYQDAPLSEGLLITAIPDDRECTSVDLNVYGSANLKLRGPANS